MPLAIPKKWLPQLPSDQPTQVDWQSQQDQMMVQQATPAGPRYCDDYIDAPTGSLRADLEAKRQGKSQYQAIPQKFAEDPIGYGSLALGATGLAPGFALRSAVAGVAAESAESAGAPPLVTAIAQNVPFATTGSGKKRLAEILLSGAGQEGGQRIDTALGLEEVSPLGGPFANLLNMAGGVAPHLRGEVRPKASTTSDSGQQYLNEQLRAFDATGENRQRGAMKPRPEK